MIDEAHGSLAATGPLPWCPPLWILTPSFSTYLFQPQAGVPRDADCLPITAMPQ